MTRALSNLALALPLLAVACQPAGPTPAQPGATGPGGPGATTALPKTNAEPGVITGRVTTELGQPIAGAQLRIVGYTGGANLGRDIETVTSGEDGVYRYEAGSGLYEVLGSLNLEFDGQEYVFDLEPADGTCDQELTDEGMVEDLVWRLTGVSPCWPAANPDAYRDYHGAPVKLWDRLSGYYSSDAVIEYTLQPTSPHADGRAGETLTMRRTVAALHTTAGPIDSTDYLYDIPLARYRVSATIAEPGAQPVQLLVATDDTTVPAQEADLTFDPRLVIGTPALGYLIANLTVHDTATGAR